MDVSLKCNSKCKCKCKCNSNQNWNNDKYRCECKNPKENNACEKDYVWNPATHICENVDYLASTVDDWVITCDEIINVAYSVSPNMPANVTSTVPTNVINGASTAILNPVDIFGRWC